MPLMMCKVCSRKTIHFNSNCTDHSDWPAKFKPKPINVVIPPYSPLDDIAGPAPRKMDHRPSHKVGASIFISEEQAKALNLLFGGELIKPTTGLICSFCRVKVEQNNATYGMGPARFFIKDTHLDPSTHTFDREIDVTSNKVVACPNCCLKVRPIVDGKGRVKTKGVKFPEFD